MKRLLNALANVLRRSVETAAISSRPGLQHLEGMLLNLSRVSGYGYGCEAQ